MDNFINFSVSMVQWFYNFLGIEKTANVGDMFVLMLLDFIFAAAFLTYFLGATKKKEVPSDLEIKKVTIEEKEKGPVAIEPKVTVGPTWSERLQLGLSRSRKEIWGKFENIFSGKALDDDLLEELEELLYSSDLGPAMVSELLETLEEKAKDGNFTFLASLADL